jgi:hypothetical protein
MAAACRTPNEELCNRKDITMADHIGITLRADFMFSTCSTVAEVHREDDVLSDPSLFVLLPARVLTKQALFRNLNEFVCKLKC